MPKKQIPIDAIVDLRRRLDQLPPRSPSRRVLVQEIAQLYGISIVVSFAVIVVCLQLLWFHLQIMWFRDPSYLQLMWFQNCLVCSLKRLCLQFATGSERKKKKNLERQKLEEKKGMNAISWSN